MGWNFCCESSSLFLFSKGSNSFWISLRITVFEFDVFIPLVVGAALAFVVDRLDSTIYIFEINFLTPYLLKPYLYIICVVPSILADFCSESSFKNRSNLFKNESTPLLNWRNSFTISLALISSTFSSLPEAT